MISITLAGQSLLLHPFRALFWEEARTLLLADLHLGKARHFRRSGIAVPLAVADANWDRLISLLIDFRPERLVFLGDLFHSDYNREWEEFCHLTEQFREVHFDLVTGNHDSLSAAHYEKARLKVHKAPLQEGPFLFSHHPLETMPDGLYNLAGHIHPGVQLRGTARQRKRLPCFYFGQKGGVLPAFGAFTGMATIRPQAGDRVFVIADEEVLEV